MEDEGCGPVLLMALGVRGLGSTTNPATTPCDHNPAAQPLGASVALLIKRDCSFLLYSADTKRPNSPYYLQMILRSQAESYYVNMKYTITFCCKTKKKFNCVMFKQSVSYKNTNKDHSLSHHLKEAVGSSMTEKYLRKFKHSYLHRK